MSPRKGGPHFSARNREGNAKNFKARGGGGVGVTDFADSDSGQSFLVIRNSSNVQSGRLVICHEGLNQINT